IDVPTVVMHGDDDQIVPIADSAMLSVKLLKNGTLKVYERFPHGMCTTHADAVNPDLLTFIKGEVGVNRFGSGLRRNDGGFTITRSHRWGRDRRPFCRECPDRPWAPR